MEKSNLQSKTSYITKSIEFSSAHYYHVESWSEEENLKKFGLCSNKCSHGHNYILHVTLKGLPDNNTGMIINLIDLKEVLKTRILSVFDHKNLNLDVKYFKQIQPTTENMCKVIWNLLKSELKDALYKVLIEEDEEFNSYYTGESEMFYITRIYKFSSSHRLNNKNLSEEENLRIFGKCNNYNLHGHNFKLEVTLKGCIEPITGMIYDILEMDKTVITKIVDKFDHKNLNDIKELENLITTGENLTRYIWDVLKDDFKPAKLYKVKLYETDHNYFEYIAD